MTSPSVPTTAQWIVSAMVVGWLLVGCDQPPPPDPPNTDPRKGSVKIDRHCGFWSCDNAYMRCIGTSLIITPADGSTPLRIADAKECKP